VRLDAGDAPVGVKGRAVNASSSLKSSLYMSSIYSHSFDAVYFHISYPLFFTLVTAKTVHITPTALQVKCTW
jgi:hypothetical protein